MDEREERRQRQRRIQNRRKRKRRQKLIRIFMMTFFITFFVFFILAMFFKLFIGNSAEPAMLQLPWSFGKTDIVLDAGHGGTDPGTIAGEVQEKDLTMAVTLKTEKILKDAGYRVRMIREDDRFIDIHERAEEANERDAKVFVSIHCNYSEEGPGSGIETFYAESKGEDSRNLAKIIQSKVIETTDASDRGIKTADFVVVKETKMPAALVETGFLSDAEEKALLLQESYQEQLAEGIAAGIIEYLEALE